MLEHSEYALVLPGAPNDEAAGPELTIRTAEAADLPEIARLLHVAFGFPAEDGAMRLVTETARTLVIEVTGAIVGTLRVTREGDAGGIDGFAVDPAQQGRGIGREVLRRVCRDLRAEGVQRVGLEVAVQNERALGLYTSVGFVPVTIEDYYEFPPADAPAGCRRGGSRCTSRCRPPSLRARLRGSSPVHVVAVHRRLHRLLRARADIEVADRLAHLTAMLAVW